MSRALDHTYIFATVLFTVYSQLVMRWKVGLAGVLPVDVWGKTVFIGQLLINPWVLSAVVATFLAGISWMLTMSKFHLSYAFPFVSLNYVLVLLASAYLFHEPVSTTKLVGITLVVTGLIIIGRS
jgi:drug/metabolite transporter (DMT)-like permease